MKAYLESDLYPPVKAFFEKLGYQVNGEVRRCDMTARKDEHLIIVELKKSFCLKLLYQALNRQKMAADVFVCIPRPKRFDRAMRNDMTQLIKKLGLGLITVALNSPVQTVDVLIFPENDAPVKNVRGRGLLLKELSGRSMDLNKGGQRGKIITAYRERAVRIACALSKTGPQSAKDLKANHGCPEDTYRILNFNSYGWFVKVEKGVYGLSEAGREALNDPKYAELVAYYAALR